MAPCAASPDPYAGLPDPDGDLPNDWPGEDPITWDAEPEPAEDEPEQSDFRLIYDPDPYPLARGMRLPLKEVVCGLLFGSFTPGAVLESGDEGQQHTVTREGKRLALSPPHPAVERGLLRLRGTGERARQKAQRAWKTRGRRLWIQQNAGRSQG